MTPSSQENAAVTATGSDSSPSQVEVQQNRIWGWFRKTIRAIGATIGLYVLIVLVGLLPVNNGFQPTAETETGAVRIYVQSSDVHADILVPLQTEIVDWNEHFPRLQSGRRLKFRYISFGWGDRGFYLQTPTWSHLTVSKSVNAMLLPSKSVMHVSLATPVESSASRSVVLSADEYKELVAFIKDSFRSADESLTFGPVPIDRKLVHDAWSDSHQFYEANGYYHVFHTCNCWVGNGLKRAGVRTALFSPFPKTVFLHWPETVDEDAGSKSSR